MSTCLWVQKNLSHVNHVNSCSISVKRKSNISLPYTSLGTVPTRWFHKAGNMWHGTRDQGVQHPQSCGSGKQTRGNFTLRNNWNGPFFQEFTIMKVCSQRNILCLSQAKEQCWMYNFEKTCHKNKTYTIQVELIFEHSNVTFEDVHAKQIHVVNLIVFFYKQCIYL